VTASLPNVLTVARLVAVPLIVLFLLADDGANGSLRWWAFALFAASAFTDWLDGYLARRWHVVTEFGKLADPLADKALVLATLMCLVVVDGIPWWPFVVILARELVITLGRLAVARTVVIPASRGGKLKTLLQMLSLGMFLVPTSVQWVDDAAWWFLVAAVVVAISSGIEYGVRIVRVRAGGVGTAV
jgi:CDP-diacylglycerol--glycerol-3-phosphate 3-phosphatidyltransferase